MENEYIVYIERLQVFTDFLFGFFNRGTLKTQVKFQEAHLKILHASGILGRHTNGAHTKD